VIIFLVAINTVQITILHDNYNYNYSKNYNYSTNYNKESPQDELHGATDQTFKVHLVILKYISKKFTNKIIMLVLMELSQLYKTFKHFKNQL